MIYLLKDFPAFMENDPVVARRVRDAYYQLAGTRRFIFFVSATLGVPEDLRRLIQILDFPLPDAREIAPLVTTAAQRYFKTDKLPEERLSRFVGAVSGLTLSEIRHTLGRVFQERTLESEEIERELFQTKADLIRKEAVLEFVSPRSGMSGIGGLENLKSWLSKRTNLVAAAARGDDEVAMPRGLLMMGVSGCGKSLSVKAISQLWGLPLFRLDMNLVFSAAIGGPEEIFHRALNVIEAVAPAILWLDEIEMGLSAQATTGASARIFARFLTWMQERQAPVFVAATANRIDLLPAEMLRRGRFDQIFFVDLPSEEERKHIFRLHLERRGQDSSRFDFMSLAQSSNGWNGAEIEQAVVSAIGEAFDEQRQITMQDLYQQIHETIPLSTTMEEQSKQLRSWARSRALNASRKPSGV